MAMERSMKRQRVVDNFLNDGGILAFNSKIEHSSLSSFQYVVVNHTYFKDFSISDDVLEHLLKHLMDICNKQIGEGYLEKSVNKSLTDPNYAMFMVVDKRNKKDGKFEFKDIDGFIIVQLGECGDYPNYYAINLVCGKKGIGQICVGFYLYVCMMNQQMFGLLELADSYYNVAGLCSYSKFGFRAFVPTTEGCFDTLKNLPMICDFKEQDLSQDDIINIILQKSKGKEKHPICYQTETEQEKSTKTQTDRFKSASNRRSTRNTKNIRKTVLRKTVRGYKPYEGGMWPWRSIQNQYRPNRWFWTRHQSSNGPKGWFWTRRTKPTPRNITPTYIHTNEYIQNRKEY